jgi:opacity protein-like surface antigen
LLTKFKSNDHFGVLFPSIAAQTTPFNEILDDLDRITDSWHAIQDAETIPEAYTKVNDFKEALHAASNLDDLNVNADISMAIAVPNQTLPFALVFKNWAKVTGRAKVTQEDLDFIDQIVSGKLIPSTTEDAEKQMSSRVDVEAVLVSEVGIAMAHSFSLLGLPVSVGVTPKVQEIDTWNYNATIVDYHSEEWRHGKSKSTQATGNVDLGFSADLTPHWTVGLSAQNLIPYDINSVDINGARNVFEMRPKVTIGTAWSNNVVTVATDIDLTQDSHFTYDKKKSQYAGVGAEYNLADLLQLRAGYRADMSNSKYNMFTAGIGISPFNVVHLDLTGMLSSDKGLGVNAALSFTF